MEGQPSDRLLADRWEHTAAANRVLPVPAGVSQSRPSGFCLQLLDLHGLPLPPALRDAALSAVSIEHKLVVSMYDTSARAFFGRQTTIARSALEKRQLAGEKLPALRLDETSFFATSVDDERCVLVIQSVLTLVRPGLDVSEHAGGWTFVSAFGSAARASAAAEKAGDTFAKRSLFEGSAAALLLLEGAHPFSDEALRPLRRAGGATLAYSFRAHTPLVGGGGPAGLMAPNALYSPLASLPGLLAPQAGPELASFEAPHLASTYTLQLVVSEIYLPAGALDAALARSADGARPGARAQLSSVALVARLHNGHCYVGARELLELEVLGEAGGPITLAPNCGGSAAAAALELRGAFLSTRLAVVLELVGSARSAAGRVVALALADAVLVPWSGARLLCEASLSLAMCVGPGVSRESGRPLAAAAPPARSGRGGIATIECVCSVAPTEPGTLADTLAQLLVSEGAAEPEVARAAAARLRADAAALALALGPAAPPAASSAGALAQQPLPPDSEAQAAVAELQAAHAAKHGEGRGEEAAFASTRVKASGMLRAYTGQHLRVALSAWRELTGVLRAQRLRTFVVLTVHGGTISEAMLAAGSAGFALVEAEMPSLLRPVRSAAVKAAATPREGAAGGGLVHLPLRLREELELTEGSHALKYLVRLTLATSSAAGGGREARAECILSLWSMLRAREEVVRRRVPVTDALGRSVGELTVSLEGVPALLRAAEAAVAATHPVFAGQQLPLSLGAAGGARGVDTHGAAGYGGYALAAPVSQRFAGQDARQPLPRAERALIHQLLLEQGGRPHPRATLQPSSGAAVFGPELLHEVLLHFTHFMQPDTLAAPLTGAHGDALEAAHGGRKRQVRSVFLTLSFFDSPPLTTPRALVAGADGAVARNATDAALSGLGASAVGVTPPSYDGRGRLAASPASVHGGVVYADPLIALSAGQVAADPLLALAGGAQPATASTDPLVALMGGAAKPAAQPASTDPLLALMGGAGKPATAAAADPLLVLMGAAKPATAVDPLLALMGGGGAKPAADPLLALAVGGAAAKAVGRERSDRLGPDDAGSARSARAAPPPPSVAAAGVASEHAGMRAPQGERARGVLWAFDATRRAEGVGLMVRFVVAPPGLANGASPGAPGSAGWRARAAAKFAEYLRGKTLYVDVWDGDSLLQLGTAALPLAPLLAAGASEHAGSAVTKAYLTADVLRAEPAHLDGEAAPTAVEPAGEHARGGGGASVGTLQLMAARVATRLELPAEPAPAGGACAAGGRTASGAARAAANGNSSVGAGPRRKVRSRALAEARGGAADAAREALRAAGVLDQDASVRRAMARQHRHARLGLTAAATAGAAPRPQPRPPAAAADPFLALIGCGAKPADVPATAAADLLLALMGGAAKPAAAATVDPLLALMGGTAPATPSTDPLLALATGNRGPGSRGPAAADPIAAAALRQQLPPHAGSGGRVAPVAAASGVDAARAAARARVAAGEAALAALATARAVAKVARIGEMLHATSSHTVAVYPSYGAAEVFEVPFRNPYALEHCFRVEVLDEALARASASLGALPGGSNAASARELHLLTDASELRAHFAAGRLALPAEEQLFAAGQLLLLPAEAVSIPFKFQSWRAGRPAGAAPLADGADLGAHAQQAPPSLDEVSAILARDIVVRLCNAQGEVVFELTVQVHR
ncbi:hypothetical protein T492DRAFT_1115108, partial [Pavlovales sp. CCMP2436]